MNIKEIAGKLGYETVTMPCPEAEVTGGYAGDLLSWVMARASRGNIWVTVMTNSNIVAVATLAEVSAIVIADGEALPQSIAALAEEHNINVLRSEKPAFETSAEIGKLIGG